MTSKIQLVLKRFIVTILCISSLTSATISAIPIAYAANGSSGILGTNAALGSPVLNNNFTINDWNKWEMICWGVFLSNFCVPLVDDYETCFMTGKGGSNGSGFKALCFGSGNDPVNNETIEKLTTYAAVQQNVTNKEIWVTYSKIENGKYTEDPIDPNTVDDTTQVMRQAKFKDFFFATKEDSSETIGNTWATAGRDTWYLYFYETGDTNYKKIGEVNEGNVPTFYIRNGAGHYVKLFDYRDAWDVQMISAMLNAVSASGHRLQDEDEFNKKYQEYIDNDSLYVKMDAFGNITADGKVFIPSAINKNITKNNKVNLMNSWVMNGYISTYSAEQLNLGLKQDIQSSINIFDGWDNTWDRRGGYPAFGQSSIGGVGLLYYDTDNIFMAEHKNTGSFTEFGELVTKLFNADVKNPKTGYTLKFEISDEINEKTTKWFAYKPDLMDQTRFVASMLSNLNPNGTAGSEVLDYIVDMYGNDIELYSDNGIIVPVMLKTAKVGDKSKAAAARLYYNFLYEVWTGSKSATGISQNILQQVLPTYTWSDFRDKVVNGFADTQEGDWWKAFNTAYGGRFNGMGGMKASDFFDWDSNDTVSDDANRLVKVYPVSNQMKAVSQIFACRDGTEFRQYSTMIYMTYLDFFGITSNTSLTGATTKTSDFSEELFDDSSDILKADLNTIIDAKSDEEKEKEVLDFSYLMLHPEQGRVYRQQLIENTLADWIYEHYNRIVYGGYNTTYTGSVSKSNSGFLSVEPYVDNWLVAWFLNNYTSIAVWLIMGCVLASIVIGVLKSKKLSWFFISILVIVNSILIIPTAGDIVPYVTSNAIQKMFASKMTYWSVSQGISNAQIESDAQISSGYMKDLTSEEAIEVIAMVKQLSSIYTDRSLMVKQDISQKITQVTTGSYSNIQAIQSARWILPMVMQQFTGDNKTENYIYKPIANIWDDMSNMYWVFDPDDALAIDSVSPTSTSGQGDSAYTEDIRNKYDNLSNYYQDFKEVLPMSNNPEDINYRSYAYTLNGDVKDQVHISFGYLPDSFRKAVSRATVFGAKAENYKDADSWSEYTNKAANGSGLLKINWATTNKGGFEETADSYNRFERSTITSDMPYLLMTENPSYYFYCLVKDTFDTTSTLGSVIGQLQGQIKEDANGEEVRANFMYATKGTETVGDDVAGLEYTEYVRDVLDLEELFTNLVPYLYQMQLTAGGFDGVSGILEDDEITSELQYYKGNKQSWMYRCNWATKLMENPDYTEGYKVGKSDGSKVFVTNQMLTEAYPEDRPMVFSEAQKQALGLKDSDLNIVELKCIEANEKVAKQWTLLINYAGTGGLTKEVLMRQMATDATLIFCDEFSSSGVLNTMYTLYPQSLDLRYISFDSVMKMLVMNVSKNTSYIYGDTMSTLIEDTDIFTSALLLIDAYVCAYFVPFMRIGLMALIFFLGFFAVIRSLLSSHKYKAKVACGQLLMNITFIAYTLVYYAIFAAMMALTSTDEVLKVSSIQASAGNPVWVLVIVLFAGLLYMAAMGWQIWFCCTHNRDMGFEAMSMAASGVVNGIGDALSRAGGSIQNFFNSEENKAYNTSNTNSIKGTGKRDQEAQNVRLEQTDGKAVKTESEDEMKDNIFMDADYMSNYNNLNETENAEYMQAAEIDAEIKAGEEINIDD